MWHFLGVILIASRLITFHPNAAFLDSQDYINLARSSWREALTLGHSPIHPGYVALIKLAGIPAALVSALAGIGTIIVFYFLVKKLWGRKIAKKAAIILALLPGVWIVQENVMVEAVSLWWLTLATYLAVKQKWLGAGVSLTTMLLTHNQMLVWLPMILGFTLLKKHFPVLQLIKVVMAAIIASALVYAGLGQNLWGLVYTKTGEIVPWWQSITDLLRYGRNGSILWLRLHTNLIGLVAIGMGIKLFKVKQYQWWLILAAIPYLFWAQFYSADFLIRRLIPISLVTAAVIAITIKNKWFLVGLIINLMVASVPIVWSYTWLNKNQVINKLHQLQAQIPQEALYIDSHFLRTINNFPGETYHLGESTNKLAPIQAIKVAFDQGQRVFIDSQAVTDPYQFYVGNQLHLLSLGKFGQSEAREIFKKFYIADTLVIDAARGIFAYELTDKGEKDGKLAPGTAILIYAPGWQNRLIKQRLDYYDLLSLLWAIATGKREPWAVTYADASGSYVMLKP